MPNNRHDDVPLLALDVDGVLNPAATWPDAAVHHVPGPFSDEVTFPLALSAEQGRAIRALPVEIGWLTTWGNAAATTIGPLVGLDGLGVLDLPRFGDVRSGDWRWKLSTVADLLDSGRRVCWVDDHAEPVASGDPDRFLWVRTRRNRGLTAEQVAVIDRWARGLDYEHPRRFVDTFDPHGLDDAAVLAIRDWVVARIGERCYLGERHGACERPDCRCPCHSSAEMLRGEHAAFLAEQASHMHDET